MKSDCSNGTRIIAGARALNQHVYKHGSLWTGSAWQVKLSGANLFGTAWHVGESFTSITAPTTFLVA